MAEAKAANKQPIIIIKKKRGGGGHAAHGGAWKVAYADFVTAMMCFFLVMWLMGSDEETKAAIAHYFNHPNSPWQQGRDPQSDMVNPMGERQGKGENLLSGLDGLNPDDIVKDPVRPVSQLEEHKELGDMARELMEDNAYAFDITLDYVKFSLPEELLFDGGGTLLAPKAARYLDKLGQLFRGYRGYITIEGHTDDPPSNIGSFSNAYEYSMARAVAVMNYIVEHHWVSEGKITPVGTGARHQFSTNKTPEGRKKNRRIEFTLSYRRQ